MHLWTPSAPCHLEQTPKDAHHWTAALICFTWLQKGPLKPLHLNSPPQWKHLPAQQHIAAQWTKPWPTQELAYTKKHSSDLLNNWKLTAAMVTASHSSFTYTMKKEEMEHIKMHSSSYSIFSNLQTYKRRCNGSLSLGFVTLWTDITQCN